MGTATWRPGGKDTMEPGSAATGVDTSKAHPARMYDYYLGGNDSYPADREAAEAGNRAFLQRVVRFLAGEAGIRQVIDIGAGLPAAGNVHEVAQRIAPDVRVAYVDNDRCKSGCAHARWAKQAP